MSPSSLKSLQDTLGYRFQSTELLEQALVHASTREEDNDRLEFLGDAALGYAVSARLYQADEQADVGLLSRRRAHLINNTRLSKLAIDLGVDQNLLLGSSVSANPIQSTKVCADALEAVIGAIAVDGGMTAVQRFVDKHIVATNTELVAIGKHAKTNLQEWAAARGYELPTYTVRSHVVNRQSESWHVDCTINPIEFVGSAVAGSKRDAERLAAEDLLAQLRNTP